MNSINTLEQLSKAESSFVVFSDYHCAKLHDLTPESIKDAAKHVVDSSKRHSSISREPIKLTTAQNWIVKTLGFKGGMSSYLHAYHHELRPFMEKHGLSKHKNLCSFRFGGFSLTLQALKRQAVSERFFYSGNPLPEKLFTGYNFPFDKTIDDGHYLANCSGNEEYSDLLLSYGITPKLFPTLNDVIRDMEIASGLKDKALPERNGHFYSGRALKDVLLGKYALQLPSSFNLLGDLLIEPSLNQAELTLCEIFLPIPEFINNKNLYLKAGEFFAERIRSYEAGWVDVIPFNDDLIFLRGASGEYDFVFRNMRDRPFGYELDNGALKPRYIPSCIDDYEFSRWYYFEFKGQRERVSQEAQWFFYKNSELKDNNPSRSVLKNYLRSEFTIPVKPRRARSNNFSPIGFKACKNLGIYISDVITIAQFRDFTSQNPDYWEDNKSSLTEFERNNIDKDESLPVSCNWYDAVAYLGWLERKTGLPVRLLHLDEFKALRAPMPKIDSAKIFHCNDVVHVNLGGHPRCIFPEKLPWLTDENGTRFLFLNSFAEWVMERTFVRSGCVSSLYGDEQYNVDPSINYGYKNVKTGFRVCYSINQNNELVN